MTSTASGSFIVLTTQRSGSTWFVDVLNANPAIVAEEELFLPRRSTGRSLGIGTNYTRFPESGQARRPIGTWRYLGTFFAEPGCMGFKLMYSQLRRFPEIWPFASVRRIPIVHLIRENLIDIAISSAIMNATNTAHYLRGEPVPSKHSVTLDPSTLIRQLERLEDHQRRARRFLALTRQPHFEVKYEDLVADHDLFRNVFQFLGVDSSEFEPVTRLHRVRTSSQSEAVANWSDVVSVVAGSRFSRYVV